MGGPLHGEVLPYLVLMDKMCKMQHVFETIPQYIDALEKVQKQAERVEMPIAESTLVMISTKVMLETKRYPKADDVCEDSSKKERKWSKWK